MTPFLKKSSTFEPKAFDSRELTGYIIGVIKAKEIYNNERRL